MVQRIAPELTVAVLPAVVVAAGEGQRHVEAGGEGGVLDGPEEVGLAVVVPDFFAVARDDDLVGVAFVVFVGFVGEGDERVGVAPDGTDDTREGGVSGQVARRRFRVGCTSLMSSRGFRAPATEEWLVLMRQGHRS